jgi:hypothetical protein
MRVHLYLSKFYNWDPVPHDVVVSPDDIASGKVMPDRNGGYRARVVKIPPGGTVRTCQITEAAIVSKIIHEKTDIRRAGRTFTRKEAVAHFIMDHLLEGEAEWGWITKIEVEDDGPNEALARSMLDPHTKAEHSRRGGPSIDPGHVDGHLAAYLEPVDAAGHAAHLHGHFGVKGGGK